MQDTGIRQAVQRYSFARAALNAAINPDEAAIHPLLTSIGTDIAADRLALAVSNGDEGPTLLAGIGVELPPPGQPLTDADPIVLSRLINEAVVVAPTPDVGWDLYMRIGNDGHCLLIDDTDAARQISRAHDQVLREAASLLDQIIGGRQVQKKLRKEAERDGLTDLFTRRFFDEQVKWVQSAARRCQFPIWVMIIDADHFKNVNDSYGHDIGDKVLRGIAAVIQESIREMDIPARFDEIIQSSALLDDTGMPARYGGEEFVVLGKGDIKAGLIVAERIRSGIEVKSPSFTNHGFTVTVSIGVSVFDCTKNSRDTIERARIVADQALYQAKEQGRNRVVLKA
ncbi:GGDEF domain-containing protein [Patescibacteria group bacterium]